MGFSCFPFDDGSIKVVAISGQPSTCSFSSMILTHIAPLTQERVLSLSPDSPVNLLGREPLCILKATMLSPLDGVSVELLGEEDPEVVTVCLL